MIDIGANLTNGRFRKDLPQVLRRAQSAGVEAVLITGTSVRSSREALQLVQQRQPQSPVTLFTTVGVHPHDAKDFIEDGGATVNEMRELIKRHPDVVVAVGECGLDFNRDFSPRDVQERVFQAQVELACELQMPLFLHEREAHEAFVRVLNPFLDAGVLPPVVVHCFTGTEPEMLAYLAMGFYIGLTGFVCMDARGFKVRSVASKIPTDKLLIETDAPFMYPYKSNGKSRCEPKDLCAVVETLAACYSLEPQQVAAITTANTKRFFDLDKRLALRGDAVEQKPASRSHAQQQQQQKQSEPAKPEISPDNPATVVLDGGSGEGGGQLVRISAALAALLKRSVRIHSIRKNRQIAGLRSQHLCTLQLTRDVSGGGCLEGAQLHSTQVRFDGANGILPGGAFTAHSATGGSVSLMLQGVMPALLFSAQPCSLVLRGGTHVGFSPTVDFMQIPLLRLLSRFGVSSELSIASRGFFPGGGGEIQVQVTPMASVLAPVDLTVASREIVRVFTRVTVYGPNADELTGQQFTNALKKAFKAQLLQEFSSGTTQLDWEIAVETADVSAKRHPFSRRGRQKQQQKDHAVPDKPVVSVMALLETSSGGLISVDRTGRDTAAFMASKITATLAHHMAQGVCVDEHLADNAIVYMALADGVSRLRVPCKADRSSQHLETALAMVALLTGATWRLHEEATSTIVEADGIGFRRAP